jgi:dihydroorotate dehydrogenase (fumarate)
VIRQDLLEWLETNNYESLADLQGIASQFNSKNPGLFERAEYVKAIRTYKPIG